MGQELTSGPQPGSHLSQTDQSNQSMSSVMPHRHFLRNRSSSLTPASPESNASTHMSPRTPQIRERTSSTAPLITLSCNVSNVSGAQAVCVDAQCLTTGSIYDRSTGPVGLGGMADTSMYGVNIIRTCDLASATCSVTFRFDSGFRNMCRSNSRCPP